MRKGFIRIAMKIHDNVEYIEFSLESVVNCKTVDIEGFTALIELGQYEKMIEKIEYIEEVIYA